MTAHAFVIRHQRLLSRAPGVNLVNPIERTIMKIKLRITALLLGAWLLPVAGYTADTSTQPTAPSAVASGAEPTAAPDATRAKSSRRSDQPIDDSLITTKIKARFLKDKQVRADNVEVKTVNGAVELTGTARSKAKAAHAVTLARQVKGVKSVKNDIEITPPETAARGDKMPDRERVADRRRSDQPVDDTLITTKVKAKMVEDKQVSATNIHVKTLNGVVELTGTAKSMEESSKAVSLARSIKGVKSVTNNIKIN